MGGGCGQDGRVLGHEVYLLPQIHQKYIYMWNDCHRLSTECWQKTQTSERTRKSPHNLVEQKKKEKQKNEKGIRDGTCPPRREL